MSVVITREDLISFAEVDYVIKHMNEKYRSKLPQNILDFFETMKDSECKVYINPYKPLQNQGLTQYALEIIALLHIKYWCEDGERKEELLEKMKQNQERFESQLREQFSVDKLFGNHTNEVAANKVSTKDPMVTAYSKYIDDNPDIQDFTDLREEQSTELTENVAEEKITLFGKIKLLVSKMFGKKAG